MFIFISNNIFKKNYIIKKIVKKYFDYLIDF